MVPEAASGVIPAYRCDPKMRRKWRRKEEKKITEQGADSQIGRSLRKTKEENKGR